MDELHPAEVHPLNETFYGGEPWRYLSRRRDILMLAHGRSREIAGLLDEGVEFGSVAMSDQPSPGGDTLEFDDFVAVESQQLVHHVGETLLRLFLAHRDTTGCPWFRLVQMRSFGEFKATAESIRAGTYDGDIRAEIQQVFLGGEDQGDEVIDAHLMILSELARYVVADADIYNAAKHGLAVVSSIGDIDIADGTIKHEGPVLTHISYTARPRRYDLVHAWVHPEDALIWSQLGLMLIQTLWSVAKARYIGHDTAMVFAIPASTLEKSLSGREGPILRASMRREIKLRIGQPWLWQSRGDDIEEEEEAPQRCTQQGPRERRAALHCKRR